MPRRILSLTLVALLTVSSLAQEKRFSGPQPGEPLTPFKVVQVSNPEKVTSVEIAKKNDDTTLIMFMHKLSEPAIGLMMTLEWFAHKQKGLSHHYVILTGDQSKSELQARRWARNPFFAKAPMSISVDGAEGPGRYGLNRKVDMTVIIAKKGKVVSNFALLGPNNSDAPKLLEALAKSVGKKAPAYDQIRKELRAERNRKRALRNKANPIYKLAPDPKLGMLMLAMVRREGSNEEYAIRSAQQMKAWANDDKKKTAALAKYCRAVLKGDFAITAPVRKQLKKLAADK